MYLKYNEKRRSNLYNNFSEYNVKVGNITLELQEGLDLPKRS